MFWGQKAGNGRYSRGHCGPKILLRFKDNILALELCPKTCSSAISKHEKSTMRVWNEIPDVEFDWLYFHTSKHCMSAKLVWALALGSKRIYGGSMWIIWKNITNFQAKNDSKEGSMTVKEPEVIKKSPRHWGQNSTYQGRESEVTLSGSRLLHLPRSNDVGTQ